ncbi:3-phosphoshikimate 1-carboxyvinyltransferase [Candidatus Margulisiibacteriota bacterium]
MKEITLKIPGDKSISHRAVIFGSLAEGRSSFKNFLASEDCLHTIQCFRDMGVKIHQEGNTVEIEGVGLYGLKEPAKPLYVGNSGTSIRLLTGILAGQKFDSEISGDESIQKRPMKRIVEPLTQMGAVIEGDERNNNIYPPLIIKGGQQLKGINYKMPIASAQVDSCIRLAGLYVPDTESSLIINNKGMKYRDHTERFLKWFKANKDVKKDKVLNIPSDISSAAFFMVAGLIIPGLRIIMDNINLNKTRYGIVSVLKNMGGNIEIEWIYQESLEDAGRITVESSPLEFTNINKEIIPTLVDEIPIIALAAALAEGTTTITGAEELRHKESDRLHTVATELNRIGANVRELEDGLVIEGVKKLHSAACKSYGDHRIAMMLKIANLVSEGEITVDDEDCIKTSFPEFEELLKKLVTA